MQKYLPHASRKSPNLAQKSVAVIGTVALAATVLMFSLVVLTLLLVVGAVMFAYLRWKTRGLRSQLREQMGSFAAHGSSSEQGTFKQGRFRGEVIEGEAIRMDDVRDGFERGERIS